MVLELADDVLPSDSPRKFCPLLNGPCIMSDCAWFLSDRVCAITRIAIRLDVLIEGVPVVRLFKDEDIEIRARRCVTPEVGGELLEEDFEELQKSARERADYKRKLIKENNELKRRIKKLEELLIEFMEYVDNPCLSTVEEACMLLGHPLKDEKGCYCRLRRGDDGSGKSLEM